MNENRSDDTAAQSGPAPNTRPAESGSGESAGARRRYGDICDSCDGTGVRDWLSDAQCLACNGTGWVEERDEDDWDAFDAGEDARESGAEGRTAQPVRPASAETDATDDGGKPSITSSSKGVEHDVTHHITRETES